MKKIVIGFAFSLFFVSLIGVYWAWHFLAYTPASDSNEEIVFEVRPGQTLSGVAKNLEEKGLIRKASGFLLLARMTKQAGSLKVGEYALRPNMPPYKILEIVNSGQSVGRKFTVSEGLNIFEISALYEAQGFGKKREFWELVNDPKVAQEMLGERILTLEGYLFPETYQITKYTDTKTVVRTMVARFLDVYRRDIEPLAKNSGMTRHELVTLASIIEKETGAPEERGLISSVFHNRLKKGMLLQTDPTVLYGKALHLGRMEIRISRADLVARTPYNTYVIRGLPPGPIANPGRAALLAALQPETSDYLYFVSRNDGTHVFSKDYVSHNKAVRKFQLDRRAREGRSWRELQQKRRDNLQRVQR